VVKEILRTLLKNLHDQGPNEYKNLGTYLITQRIQWASDEVLLRTRRI